MLVFFVVAPGERLRHLGVVMKDFPDVPPAQSPSLKVGDLLALAHAQATKANAEVSGQWTKGSFALAGAASLGEVAVHLQELGKFDVLLRSLEGEVAGRTVSVEPSHADMLSFDFQASLSRQWVLSAYEALRTLQWSDPEGRMAELLRRLELVRVPLAKLRIAKDQRGLGKGGSIELVRRGDPPDKPGETYTANGKTTYWPQAVFDPVSGSVGWSVIDLKNQVQVEILRRDLSDELLSLFAAVAPRREEAE